ncbi:MAG: hypothetical protein IPM54_07515 [Polyangiaceae bacterium]|nr:hypothetical protein [Polyangiaceae bacterium]
MLSRFRHCGMLMCLFAVVGAGAVAGCGGAGETTKTPVAETKPAVTVEEETPDVGEAKSDASVDKTAPAKVEPTPPKERFALPNIEIDRAEDREKVAIGGKEVSAEACLLDTTVSEMKHEWFSDAIRGLVAAPDGALYVFDHEKKVRRYVPEAGEICKLAIDAAFGEKGILQFPTELDRITMLDDGTLVGLGRGKIHKYLGGKFESIDCNVDDLFPDGKLGFDHFADEIRKIDVAAECKETDWKYKGWVAPKPEKGKNPEKYNVQSVRPWGKDYLVHMTIWGSHYLGIHSPDGKLKVKLGRDRDREKNVKDGEDICWAASTEKCAAGLCLLDSNCRRLSAWDPNKGTMIDTVELSDLLGVFYPWPVAIVSAKGAMYMAVSHKEKKPENAPKDAKDVSHALIFRIKGLN